MHISEEKKKQTNMVKEFFQKIITFALLCFSLQNCDPGYSVWVKKESIQGFECRDTERILILVEKSVSLDEPSNTEGRITGIGSSQIQIQIDNAKKRDIEYNDKEIVYLFGGALGALPEWAQLKIMCPSSGQVVFDSGIVRAENAFCVPEDSSAFGRKYWFFGLKDGFEKETCCPKGIDCKKFLSTD